MKTRWPDRLVTDERLDRFEDGCDRWTKITAWIFGMATFLCIVLPAIFTILLEEALR